jgi:intein-encoded DNA endonuclease-like protein
VNFLAEKLYEKVVALKNKGFGSRKIAKILNINHKKIEPWLYPRNGKVFKPRPEPETSPSPELAYMIGAILGDGCLYRNVKWRKHEIKLKVKDKDFAEEFRKCLMKVAKRKVSFFVSEKLFVTLVSCKPLFLYLKNWSGLVTTIISYPQEFIRGFADAEGCLYISKSHGEKYKYLGVKLYNTNLDLLSFIRTLLFKLGITSHMQTIHLRPPRKTCYSININRHKSVERFLDSIGFTIRRKMAVREKFREMFL